MHDDFLRLGEISSSELPAVPRGYRWSDRIWVSRRGAWMALYRPLNLGLCYLRPGAASLASSALEAKNRDRLFEKLTEEHFWVSIDSRAEDEEHAQLVEKARSGTFRFICILPTTGCELKCAYCHQLVKKGQEQRMTLEEIGSGLTKCASLCTDLHKPVDILIYGGEPLAAFDITEEILRLAHPASRLFRQAVRLCFTTSGIELTPEQADILTKNDVFVIVSIDGAPESNDSIRRSTSDRGAYHYAERAILMLQERGCRVGLSITIGKHNADNLPHHVEYLLERFGPNDVGLNAFLHRRGKDVNPYQIESEDAFLAVVDGFKMARKYGVFAEQPMRRLRPFVFRQALLKDCSAGGERLVLAPGGLLGFCDSCFPDGRYFYAQEHFPTPDHPDFQAWASLSAPEMPECRACPAMTVCGGACRYDAFKASGRLDGVDPLRCHFELSFLHWMIWQLFDLSGQHEASYYFPLDEDRKRLIEEISLAPENQPFTAGSYSK